MLSARNKVGVGIDFGTTNSVVAVFDGDTVSLVPLEEQVCTDQSVMPSATYIDQDLQTKTGQAAIDQYIADNTGRTVELIPEVIGEESQFVDNSGGEEIAPVQTSSEKIYGAAVTDAGLNGRLFRGTKRLLGDEHVRRLMVFDHPFRLVALVTPILLRLKRGADAFLAKQIDTAHLGHPVNFEGRDKFRNELALTRLGEAYKYSGITGQHFFPEPIAAAVSYLHSNPQADARYILTFDFGGGTLDLCLLQRDTSKDLGFAVVGTHGIGLGGDHIDQLLFRQLLFPQLGEGELWRRKGIDREIETRFPFGDFADLLLNWAITYTLNQNRYTTPVMECIEQGGPARRKFERLRDVIKHNLSYLLFARLKEFKATLSTQTQATLDIPEIDVAITLQREEFEQLIAPLVQQAADAVDVLLTKVGLAADDVELVLRTGGSSLIPAFWHMLDERFSGRVVEYDPFTSVASGLAIASYLDMQYPG